MEQLPLRDIHLPAPISWWPPAIGWWLLLALVILIVIGTVWAIRRTRRMTPAKLALQELDGLQANTNQSALEKIQNLSVLMKRVALTLRDRDCVAGLTGDEWLRWLDETMSEHEGRFRQGLGRLLVEAPYRPTPPGEELDALFDLCRQWLSVAGKPPTTLRFFGIANAKRWL